MATKTKKELDEKQLNEVLDMFKQYLEKADKKLSKELEDEKTDEELYQERKEEILGDVNKIVEDSKKVIICSGDGGTMMNGSTYDKLNIVGNIIYGLADNYNVPKSVFEDILEQVYERV